MKKRYYAVFGRIPEQEDDVWCAPKPTTEPKAVKQFENWLHECFGNDKQDRKDLRKSYGYDTIVVCVVASDSPIEITRNMI